MGRREAIPKKIQINAEVENISQIAKMRSRVMILREDINSRLARINSKLPELYCMIYSGYFSQCC
jgi:hypothetical protein